MVFKAGPSAQHVDGRIGGQDVFVFGAAQVIDERLLLRKEQVAPYDRRGRGNARIKWAFPAQMGDMGSPDHDLGRNASHIHTGSPDDAAFDERNARSALDRLQGRGHRGGSASNDRDVDLVDGGGGRMIDYGGGVAEVRYRGGDRVQRAIAAHGDVGLAS